MTTPPDLREARALAEAKNLASVNEYARAILQIALAFYDRNTVAPAVADKKPMKGKADPNG